MEALSGRYWLCETASIYVLEVTMPVAITAIVHFLLTAVTVLSVGVGVVAYIERFCEVPKGIEDFSDLGV